MLESRLERLGSMAQLDDLEQPSELLWSFVSSSIRLGTYSLRTWRRWNEPSLPKCLAYHEYIINIRYFVRISVLGSLNDENQGSGAPKNTTGKTALLAAGCFIKPIYAWACPHWGRDRLVGLGVSVSRCSSRPMDTLKVVCLVGKDSRAVSLYWPNKSRGLSWGNGTQSGPEAVYILKTDWRGTSFLQ